MFVYAQIFFFFPHFVRERSTQVRRRRGEDGGRRIPSWSSRGVEMSVTGGARGKGGQGRGGRWIAGRDKFIAVRSISLRPRRAAREREREESVTAAFPFLLPSKI